MNLTYYVWTEALIFCKNSYFSTFFSNVKLHIFVITFNVEKAQNMHMSEKRKQNRSLHDACMLIKYQFFFFSEKKCLT